MIFKLSLGNIKRSVKDYSIYFITLILAVCIFYVFNSLDSQTAMLEMTSNTHNIVELLINILNSISIFVSVVLGCLIIYATRFLMKKRKREFAIYLSLGMNKSKISLIILIETMIIGFVSLIIGLIFGIIISQVTSVFAANLFEADMEKYTFNFSLYATIKSFIYYALIYLVVMIFNIITVSKQRLITLLESNKQQEKVIFRNSAICIILFILSVLMLAFAYFLVTEGFSLFEEFDVTMLAVPIILGILGTICFYYSVSGMFLKIIKKCKSFYYKNINSFTIKQISSKINTTVISVSMICVMLFFSLCILTSAFTIKNYYNNSINTFCPVDFEIVSYQKDGFVASVDDIIEGINLNKNLSNDIEFLQNFSIYYDKNMTYGKSFGSLESSLKTEFPYVYWDSTQEIISEDDYNKIAEVLHLEKVSLNKDEYAILSNFHSELYDKSLANKEKLTVFNKTLHPKYDKHINGFVRISSSPNNIGILIVDSSVINKNAVYNAVLGNYKSNVTKENQKEYAKFVEQLANYKNANHYTKVGIKEDSVGLSAIVTFIGLYVGLIFLIVSTSILSLKLLSDCIDDKAKYISLMKIGVEKSDIKRSIFYQSLIFFVAPFSLSLVHTIFGLIFCMKVLSFLGIGSGIFVDFIYTLLALIAIYTIYFIATFLLSKRTVLSKS